MPTCGCIEDSCDILFFNSSTVVAVDIFSKVIFGEEGETICNVMEVLPEALVALARVGAIGGAMR